MKIIEKFVYFRPSFTVRIIAGLAALLLMVAACTLVGVTDQVRGLSERDAQFQGRNIEEGARVYFEQCARCHGVDGKGLDGQGPALSSERFVGRVDETGAVLVASERIKEIGWQGTLRAYVEAVTAAGIPLKSSGLWDAAHPTYSNAFGGPLRDDEIKNVALFVANWAKDPATSGTIDAPKPGEGQVARPTPVPLTPEQEAGKQVYLKQGCNACHAIRGVGTQGAIGPNMNQLAKNAEEIRIKDATYKGTAKTAAEYIRESIVNPNLYIVPACPQGACLPNLMPQTYATTIPAAELDQLIGYLSTLK